VAAPQVAVLNVANPNEIWVTGLGCTTALGPDLRSTWQGLMAGKSAISLQRPVPALPAIPLAMVGLDPVIDPQVLATQAVAEALRDAGLAPPLPACGVVVGSSRSGQGMLEALARSWLAQGQSPPGDRWLTALPGEIAAAVARQVGTQQAAQSPMAACATGLLSLAQARFLLASGCDQVVAGAVEAPITPLTLAGFNQMKVLASTGCYPFDRRREGLVLGEGAGIMMLERAAVAQRRGARPYGRLLGVGLSADAYHISTPDPSQQGSQRAIHQALVQAGLTADAVDYIHAHGTGTPINDCHELALLQRCFPTLPPFSSTKGATGHTLGASGALGAVVCLMALRQQVAPPNVGLEQPMAAVPLLATPRKLALEVALCLSFGFGGQNGAAVFGR